MISPWPSVASVIVLVPVAVSISAVCEMFQHDVSVLATVNEQRKLKERSCSHSALCWRPSVLECGLNCCGFNARRELKRLCLNRASPGLTHSKNSLLMRSVLMGAALAAMSYETDLTYSI